MTSEHSQPEGQNACPTVGGRGEVALSQGLTQLRCGQLQPAACSPIWKPCPPPQCPLLPLRPAPAKPSHCSPAPAPPASCPSRPSPCPSPAPRTCPTHVVDLLLVLPAVPAVIHLGEHVLGDAGHPTIAVLVPGVCACHPPGCPGVDTHRGPQLCQVHRVSGVEGQRPAVVAVTVCRVGAMMRMVGVRDMQGHGPRRTLIPGTLAGPGPTAQLC